MQIINSIAIIFLAITCILQTKTINRLTKRVDAQKDMLLDSREIIYGLPSSNYVKTNIEILDERLSRYYKFISGIEKYLGIKFKEETKEAGYKKITK